MERFHPLVIVDDLGAPRVDAALAHHLRVRRVRDGDEVVLSNGRGAVVPAIVRVRQGSIAFEVGGCPRQLEAPTPPVGVATFLPSRERLAWEIQKLTEVGADEIWLLAEPTDRRAGHGLSPAGMERLERIAREAAMQSERPFVPVLHPPCSVAELLDVCRGSVALLDPDGGELPESTTVLIAGPESGHVPVSTPIPRVRLATPILRTETAALIAAFVLVAKRADFVGLT